MKQTSSQFESNIHLLIQRLCGAGKGSTHFSHDLSTRLSVNGTGNLPITGPVLYYNYLDMKHLCNYTTGQSHDRLKPVPMLGWITLRAPKRFRVALDWPWLDGIFISDDRTGLYSCRCSVSLITPTPSDSSMSFRYGKQMKADVFFFAGHKCFDMRLPPPNAIVGRVPARTLKAG